MIDTIVHGDCLEVMPSIPAGSVDMILCDLPYGVTRNAWDSVIPMTPLWSEYRRVIKDNGAIVLTAQQPFTTSLINAAQDIFKYSMVWEKNYMTGFLNAYKQPLRMHEDILVFYKRPPTYNPQKTKGDRYVCKQGDKGTNYGKSIDNYVTVSDGMRFPTSVVKFGSGKGTHPTEKPVALFEYLIKTYTGGGAVGS